MFNSASLKRYCSAAVFDRGRRLWVDGSVLGYSEDGSDFEYTHVDASVLGSTYNEYTVSLVIDDEHGKVVTADCDCPAFEQYGLCKHCVALGLEYIERHTGAAAPLGGFAPSATSAQVLSGDKNLLTNADIVNTLNGIIERMENRPQSPVRNTTASGRTLAPRTVRSSQAVENLIYNYATDGGLVLAQGATGSIRIVPELRRIDAGDHEADALTLRVGMEKLYVVRSFDDFVDAFSHGKQVRYGKDLTFTHDRRFLQPRSRKILDFVTRIVTTQKAADLARSSRSYWYGASRTGRNLCLSEQDVCAFFELLKGETCEFFDDALSYGNKRRRFSLNITEGNPDFSCNITEAGNGDYEMTLPDDFCAYGYADHLYVRVGSQVYCCSPAFSRDMTPFFRSIGNRLPGRRTYPLTIARKDMAGFCASALPTLRENLTLTLPKGIESYTPAPARFAFFLDVSDGRVTCIPKVTYDESEFNLLAPIMRAELYRDLRGEGRVIAAVGRYFSETLPDRTGMWFPSDNLSELVTLLEVGIDELGTLGEVFISDALDRVSVRQSPTVKMGLSVESGLLDIKISAEGVDFAHLRSYLDSFRRKRRFHQLKDGTIVRLDDEGLAAVSNMLEGLGVDFGKLEDGEFSAPLYRALYVDRSLQDVEGLSFNRDATFRTFIREFDTVDENTYPEPPELAHVLRSYQKIGFRWLCMLDKLGFGGILADDMGLGKTLQVIAFLLAKKESGELGAAKGAVAGTVGDGDSTTCADGAECDTGVDSAHATDDANWLEHAEQLPALIVCPASLVYNWTAEFKRFAPCLSVVPVVGDQATRAAIVARRADFDVLVTSYDLAKRDLDAYADTHFRCLVIDEAQYIKNPGTQSAKAVKDISARTRFALTGTPIENRLSELWSIFDFLMPGLLGTHRRFQAHYEKPITVDKDDDAARRLQMIIKPFILRRLKGEVLADLPEKTENIIRSCMESEQRKLYDAVVMQLKLTLEKQLPEEFQRGRIAVLAELTKLRQICCDPHLLYDNYTGGSAKLDTCMELVENAIDGGHRVLLFSQFTSMLDILAVQMDKRRLPYHMLTGATSKEKRAEMVRSFAIDQVPVFLISLKAGGTGLNLTAADIVIHYDPWWNLAAQNQATDRVHRIGQDKAVGVFKLIAENSIEERIVDMQESKRDLAERVLGGDGMGAASLTRDDLLALLEE